MKKTLLDEFAMAALTGWVSTIKSDATVNAEKVAESLYDVAEAMMAERTKRNHQCEKASRNAEREWEKLMMQLVGEDGLGSVADAINRLKRERDNAWQELREIRDAVGASSIESAVGEVRRLTSQKANLHNTVDKLQDQYTHWHQQRQHLTAKNAELVAQVEVLTHRITDLTNANALSGKCLRQIQADAGLAGCLYGIRLRSKGPCNDFCAAADEYAKRVKAGEV